MALKPPHLLASVALAFSLTATALPAAAEGLTIGVVAPATERLVILGQQVLAGAGFAAAAKGDTIVPVNDSCAAGDGAAIADALINAKVSIATGFLCSETLEEALPKLKEAGIPAITLGVRSGVLMVDALKNGWPLFRLAPSQASEIQKLADVIATEWSAEPFALVDDGALANHDLVESLRAALEEKNVKPVLSDTLRPGQDQQLTLVRHLNSAGVTRAFVAGDRDDVAVLAADLERASSKIELLAGASIETTPGEVPMSPGVAALVLKDAAALPANADLVASLRAKDIEPEGYVLPAVAAVTIAEAAAVAAADEKKPLAEALLGRAFDTPVGPVRFNERHELTENPYEIRVWNGETFVQPARQ